MTEQVYAVEACAPDDLTDAEMTACIDLVADGGAVKKRYAAPGLRGARGLAVVRKGDHIVGVGAIKRIRPEYAAQRARWSGYDFPADMPELGYVARHPDHGGNKLGPRIVAALLSRHNGPLWATTDSDPMKDVLAGAGFVHRGDEWQGDRGRLSLWLKG